MRTLMTAALLLASAGSSMAADPLAPPFPGSAAPQWSSLYIGLQGGYAFDDSDDCLFHTGSDQFGCDSEDLDNAEDGEGGAQAGFYVGGDVQVESIVFGGVAGASWIDFERGTSVSFDPDEFNPIAPGVPFDNTDYPGFPNEGVFETFFGPPSASVTPFESYSYSERLDWYATARFRGGYAPFQGPVLVYGTAGLAFGERSWEADYFAAYTPGEALQRFQFGFLSGETPGPEGCTRYPGPGFPPAAVTCEQHAEDDEIHIGYALGGGLEYLLGRHFSVKAEYLYVNLGESDSGDIFDDTQDFMFGSDLVFHSATLGGAYRF